MEATSGFSALRWAIDTLKSLQTWFLVGLCFVLLFVWWWPDLPSPIEQYRHWMPIAGAVVAIFAICKLLSSFFVLVADRRRRVNDEDRARLRLVYGPLLALFLVNQFTVARMTGAPHLRDRLENAWDELFYYRFWRAGFRHAWRALFDRRVSQSVEIEYGEFPMQEILRVVKAEEALADRLLMELVGRALRSRRDDPGREDVTEAEYALYLHIDGTHRRLSRRHSR